LLCVAACCSVLQCVAVCCSVLQCVAVCCSVLQRAIHRALLRIYRGIWQIHRIIYTYMLACSIYICILYIQYVYDIYIYIHII